MIDTSLFPYETFPIRLEFGEKKDATLCYFQCDEHLQKYLTRHKLDKRKVKVTYRDGDPTKPGKGNKNKVRSGTTKTSSGSTTTTSRSTKNVDSSGNTNRTRKPKSTAKPKPVAKPKATTKPKPKPKSK
jgi:hypothetical protein